MEQMTRYAQIPEIKGVAFSDPWYDESVWCQYRKDFRENDWYMKMETLRDEEGYFDVSLFLGRRTLMAQLSVEKGGEQGDSVSYPYYCNFESTEIGIDTAKVYIGNLENFAAWGEEGAIRTGVDGMFGELFEFTCKNEAQPAGFVLFSALDGSITNEDELFMTLLSSFEGKEIDKEKYNHAIDNLAVKAMIANEHRAAKTVKTENAMQQENSDHDR